MFYNYYQSDEYQYDSCTSKGICSLTPVVSSLQEVIVLYLKNIAYYTLKLHDMGVSNANVRDNVIETLSALVSNTDFLKEEYERIIYTLHEMLNQSKILYKSFSKNQNLEPETLKSHLKMTQKFDLNKIIKQGEREFLKKSRLFSIKVKNLFEIMFFLIKSVCINLIELKSYEMDCEETYLEVLKLLNLMNFSDITEKEIMKEIEECVKLNYNLVKLLKDAQIAEYGEPVPVEVSFSTRPNKAILVAGSSLKELEMLLEATEGKKIDVYTHGAMILAHTYPKFKKYKNLRGQFGIGVENCLLDFATFPGAILMTKHSLQDIEYLYRGRLFTTDMTSSKGIVKIVDNDFSPVIKAAMESKGFSKGMKKEPMAVGFFEKEVLEDVDKIADKINTGQIDNIFIIGNLTKNSAHRKYFEKFIEIQPKKSSVISLNCENVVKNIFQIHSCYDFTFIYDVLERLSKKVSLKKIKLHIFLTKCDMHTIANVLNMKYLGIKNIYISACSPKLINPTIMEAFKKIFKIKTMTNPEYDMAVITGKEI